MAYTVTTYRSPKELSTAIGRNVVAGVDEKQLAALVTNTPTHEIVCNGLSFTFIEGNPVAGTKILAKGIFYTVVKTI